MHVQQWSNTIYCIICCIFIDFFLHFFLSISSFISLFMWYRWLDTKIMFQSCYLSISISQFTKHIGYCLWASKPTNQIQCKHCMENLPKELVLILEQFQLAHKKPKQRSRKLKQTSERTKKEEFVFVFMAYFFTHKAPSLQLWCVCTFFVAPSFCVCAG